MDAIKTHNDGIFTHPIDQNYEKTTQYEDEIIINENFLVNLDFINFDDDKPEEKTAHLNSTCLSESTDSESNLCSSGSSSTKALPIKNSIKIKDALITNQNCSLSEQIKAMKNNFHNGIISTIKQTQRIQYMKFVNISSCREYGNFGK